MIASTSIHAFDYIRLVGSTKRIHHVGIVRAKEGERLMFGWFLFVLGRLKVPVANLDQQSQHYLQYIEAHTVATGT